MLEELTNYYKNKRVLVTGHTGFKGSWLTIWLYMLGAKVTGYALDPKTQKDNFVLSGIGSKILDIKGDIRDRKKLIKIFGETNPEIVFHLAAQPLVLEGYKDPAYTYETNILGTVNVLEAIRKTDSVKAGIIVTSDKVYENKEWIWPYRENDKLGGHDPYSASKGATEIVVASYIKAFFNPKNYNKHKKIVASVRAGNVIGGGDWSENRIIPDIIRALEKDEVISVRNPLATRPWQYVLEPLGGYLLLGMKMLDQPEKYSGAWNFGPEPGNMSSVKELVELCIDSYGEGKWKDVSDPAALHEARLLSLDISKAKYNLGWHPVLGIRDTVKRTMEWYKQYTSRNVYDFCANQITQYLKFWR